jgi:hypothetical protein
VSYEDELAFDEAHFWAFCRCNPSRGPRWIAGGMGDAFAVAHACAFLGLGD